jgi:Flp pilus assembly protein TadG
MTGPCSPTLPRRRRRPAERGQVLVLFAVVLPVLAAIIALMVDIGGAAITYHRAQVAVDCAAFAAAQAVDVDALDHTQKVELEPNMAAQLAGQYASLNSRGELQILSLYVSGDTVYVTGQMVYRTLFAGAFGIDTIRARVSASATPAFGIVVGGQ